MMIYYGVSTFSPRVRWEDYRVRENYRLHDEKISAEEKARIRQEQRELDERRRHHEKRFETHLFYTAVPLGITAIIIGSLITVQVVGAGLIFGGIFSVTQGYACYWSELDDWMRFVSLAIVFALLVYIGYRKLAGASLKS